MKTYAFVVLALVATSQTATHLNAQDADLVIPGDGTLQVDVLQPFEAEYEQMGFPFRVRLVKTRQERPVWSFQMTTEGPTGVAIDHVGHFADDLSFAYRRFGFGAFRDEHIDVVAREGGLDVRRLVRTEDEAGPEPMTLSLGAPVVDGTFVYWALGTLPLAPGRAWQFRTWSPTADAAVVRESSPLRVVGRETLALADGSSMDTWVVSATSEAGDVRMWVTSTPPYLVRQAFVDESGTVTPVIEFKRMR